MFYNIVISFNLSCPGGSLPEPMEWSRSQNHHHGCCHHHEDTAIQSASDSGQSSISFDHSLPLAGLSPLLLHQECDLHAACRPEQVRHGRDADTTQWVFQHPKISLKKPKIRFPWWPISSSEPYTRYRLWLRAYTAKHEGKPSPEVQVKLFDLL